MGCCQRCCTATCFAVCTLLTIGLTFGVLIYATIVTAKFKEANSTLFITLCVITCFTGMIFIFGMYASCCSKNCAKSGLAAIYIIYALVLGGVAILIFIYRSSLVDSIREAYKKGDYKLDQIADIEKTFKCKFPAAEDKKTQEDEPENSKDCFDKINEYVEFYGLIIGCVLLGLFLILFIASIFACKLACKKNESSSGSKSRDQVGTPLTYGW